MSKGLTCFKFQPGTAWKVSVFGVIPVRIRTEYWEIHRISPYLFRIQGNTDLNNSEYGNFSCSVGCNISIVSMEILASFTRVKNSSPNINRRAENSTRYNGVKFFSCNNHLFFIRITYEGLKFQLVMVFWNFSPGWNLDCKNWLSLHWWWCWPKSFGKGINVIHLLLAMANKSYNI